MGDPDGAAAAHHSPRPGAWRVVLPLVPGRRVLLADLAPRTVADLRMTFPTAVALERDGHSQLPGSVIWDGIHPPIRTSSIGLLVTDDRDAPSADGLDAVLTGDSARAAIVPSRRPHTYALYPQADDVHAMVGAWWPPMTSGSPRTRLGYVLAGTPMWRILRRSGLTVTGGGRSLADVVAAQVQLRTGAEAHVRGIFVGRGRGQLTFRVHAGGRQFAVRLALTSAGKARLAAHNDAIGCAGRALGEPRSFRIPIPLYGGTEEWGSWSAEPWVPGRGGPGGPMWSRRGRGWDLARRAARELAASPPAGAARPGWAGRWVAPLQERTGRLATPLAGALAPLESGQIPLGLCHGDLWPGNVLLRPWSTRPWVIDWERGRDDAPLGLDGLHLELYRSSETQHTTFAGVAASVLRGLPLPAALMVGRRPWGTWSRGHRQAFVVAAVVHYLSGASHRDGWERSWVETQLRPVLDALAAPDDDP